ncbi:unnamed protein product, partial [Laminaria digitata]
LVSSSSSWSVAAAAEATRLALSSFECTMSSVLLWPAQKPKALCCHSNGLPADFRGIHRYGQIRTTTTEITPIHATPSYTDWVNVFWIACCAAFRRGRWGEGG